MFIIGAGVRRCPNCKVFIEKNGGCPQMQCSRCDYNFCWCCMSEGGYNHATWYKPCPGLPFGIVTNLFITIVFIVVWPIILILFPLLCAFPITFGLVDNCLRNARRGSNYPFCWALLFFIIYIIVLPFALIGAGLVVCVCLLFGVIPFWLACLLFII